MAKTQDTLTVTSTVISEKGEPVQSEVSTVKFKVAYPKGYKGDRFWNDGDVIETSKESAAQFEEMGLGKIQK